MTHLILDILRLGPIRFYWGNPCRIPLIILLHFPPINNQPSSYKLYHQVQYLDLISFQSRGKEDSGYCYGPFSLWFKNKTCRNKWDRYYFFETNCISLPPLQVLPVPCTNRGWDNLQVLIILKWKELSPHYKFVINLTSCSGLLVLFYYECLCNASVVFIASLIIF